MALGCDQVIDQRYLRLAGYFSTALAFSAWRAATSILSALKTTKILFILFILSILYHWTNARATKDCSILPDAEDEFHGDTSGLGVSFK